MTFFSSLDKAMFAFLLSWSNLAMPWLGHGDGHNVGMSQGKYSRVGMKKQQKN
jgi:hypothetical protein